MYIWSTGEFFKKPESGESSFVHQCRNVLKSQTWTSKYFKHATSYRENLGNNRQCWRHGKCSNMSIGTATIAIVQHSFVCLQGMLLIYVQRIIVVLMRCKAPQSLKMCRTENDTQEQTVPKSVHGCQSHRSLTILKCVIGAGMKMIHFFH